MSDSVLLRGVTKSFATSKGALVILEAISCAVKAGEKVAIIGPSGSGKSTLLSLIGLLDAPSSGDIEINGQGTKVLTEAEQAKFRNQHIGFVFQSFELIAPFTVYENIVAPLEVGGKPVDETKVRSLIAMLGLTDRAEALPYTLSGGEKQRVAIARALVQEPALILADEPTGSLDRQTGEKVLELLLSAVAGSATTLIIITHDESIADRMDRVFVIKDRQLHERL